MLPSAAWVQTGPSAKADWRDRLVFSFRPHSSHFLVSPDQMIPIPEGLSGEDAVFLPNMETAVNLVQDSAPLLGERVLVLGQGVVGLLAAAILREFPLECLVTADRYIRRREASASLGVTAALDPAHADFRDQALQLSGDSRGGFDLTLELTGNPSALNEAVALTAFSGRVVVGSWYGTKTASIEFGGRFHRLPHHPDCLAGQHHCAAVGRPLGQEPEVRRGLEAARSHSACPLDHASSFDCDGGAGIQNARRGTRRHDPTGLQLSVRPVLQNHRSLEPTCTLLRSAVISSHAIT